MLKDAFRRLKTHKEKWEEQKIGGPRRADGCGGHRKAMPFGAPHEP